MMQALDEAQIEFLDLASLELEREEIRGEVIPGGRFFKHIVFNSRDSIKV